MLDADNADAMRSAKLNVRLEKLGVLRSYSRERLSNGDPAFRSCVPQRQIPPQLPQRPCDSKEEPCQWAASIVVW